MNPNMDPYLSGSDSGPRVAAARAAETPPPPPPPPPVQVVVRGSRIDPTAADERWGRTEAGPQRGGSRRSSGPAKPRSRVLTPKARPVAATDSARHPEDDDDDEREDHQGMDVTTTTTESEDPAISPALPPRTVHPPPPTTAGPSIATVGSLAAREVDFYHNPTVLSRLILNQKYNAAIQRVHLFPDEASIWVCSKRQPETATTAGASPPSATTTPSPDAEYSLRQLPIHIAVANLRRTLDPQMRTLLNELIATLIVANPTGSALVDHDGHWPLHQAIWHGASPETIALFFMAHPESVESKDKRGRTLTELNQYRSGDQKEEVQEVLNIGTEFWRQAHEEAGLRLKKNNLSFPLEPAESVSVLGSSRPGDDTIVFSDDEDEDLQRVPAPDPIRPISWEQVEQRALALEQILTEMNEKNYELNKRIEDIDRRKSELSNEIDKLRNSEMMKELVFLQRENNELTERLKNMDLLIRTAVHADDDASSVPGLSTYSLHQVLSPLDKQDFARVNDRLLNNYDKLYKKHKEQTAHIRRLKMLLDGRESGELPSVSQLTDSDYSPATVREVRNFWGSSSELMATTDDLDAIFRLAATQEHEALRGYGHPPPPLFSSSSSNMPDDLSAMFREAVERGVIHKRDLEGDEGEPRPAPLTKKPMAAEEIKEEITAVPSTAPSPLPPPTPSSQQQAPTGVRLTNVDNRFENVMMSHEQLDETSIEREQLIHAMLESDEMVEIVDEEDDFDFDMDYDKDGAGLSPGTGGIRLQDLYRAAGLTDTTAEPKRGQTTSTPLKQVSGHKKKVDLGKDDNKESSIKELSIPALFDEEDHSATRDAPWETSEI